MVSAEITAFYTNDCCKSGSRYAKKVHEHDGLVSVGVPCLCGSNISNLAPTPVFGPCFADHYQAQVFSLWNLSMCYVKVLE